VQRWVFYDDRKDSPTYKMLNSFTFGERNRVLLIIPKAFITPCRMWDDRSRVHQRAHATLQPCRPDKYRLPAKNNLIPSTSRRDVLVNMADPLSPSSARLQPQGAAALCAPQRAQPGFTGFEVRVMATAAPMARRKLLLN